MDTIDDRTYGALAEHFDTQQIIEICFTVGLSNMVNRSTPRSSRRWTA